MKYAVAALLATTSAYGNNAQQDTTTIHNMNEALQKASVAYLDIHTYFEDALKTAKQE
tara:strand:- start:1027 stop:1200 length:174 start_codon:yes stop_codon:yes gene_type:complete